ncbi:MAG: arginine decarboxylase, pyruvoyl-dependent [Bacteroidetes bacterium]|nr:arginine decarboxylase, pyruvoyl-dependent [Rhodothermia bacterium]MCS7155173.1 arginine decarboxylase, pyruvoyl-dependent [Bacteroidota bacterium]MCX7906200.1 arginine decarboxylase, pyruvoyl-dependent [Bacteroidota bacterium]MDW8138327.1 arginine decarboxylase, pyruvoyl-dependent [Bacteroidota bacterium]MDW8286012.1 arginine decarboxylase, pyruvoyl-dependent [Bacteroidota bacterium]
MYVPRKVFFTKGVGVHKERLSSFEMALRKAGIAQFNLVRVSSIFPPGCKIVSPQEGLKELKPGQIVHVVMSEAATNEPNRLIAAAIGLALPADKTHFGYLSEHHSYGETAKVAGEYAEDLAAEMLATILGVEFDPDQSWDEKEEIWKISGKIVTSRHIVQTAEGDKHGRWKTVIAAAVLIP